MPSYTVYPATQTWSGSGLNGSTYGTNPAGSNFQNLNSSNVSSNNQSCSFSVPKSSSNQYFALVPSAPCVVTSTPQQTTPTNQGYRSNVCLEPVTQPDGKYTSQDYPVSVSSIGVTVGVDMTSIATGTVSCWVYARLYGVSASTGTMRFLGQGVSGTVNLSTGMNNITSGVPSFVLNADEILQLEIALGFLNNGTLAGTISGWVGINLTTSLTYTAVAQIPASLSDSAPASDGVGRMDLYPRAETETLTTSASLGRSGGVFGRGVSEPVQGVDSLGRRLLLPRSLAETTSLSDTVGRQIVYYRPESTEQVYGIDSLSVAQKDGRSFAEQVYGIDNAGRFQILNRSLAETVTGVDTLGRTYLAYRPESTEQVYGIDSLTRTAQLNRGENETVQGIDSVARALTYVRYVHDGPGDDALRNNPSKSISDIVTQSDGKTPYLGGATVLLIREDNVIVQGTTSSTVDGSYEFIRNTDDPYTYSVIAYDDADSLQAITPRGLAPS